MKKFFLNKKNIIKQLGLSLIEVICGLTIFFFIITSLIQIFHSYAENWNHKLIVNEIYQYLETSREKSLIQNKDIEISVLTLKKHLESLKYDISRYLILYKSFYKKNLIIFSANTSKHRNYSNGTLSITNLTNEQKYSLIINKSGKIEKK